MEAGHRGPLVEYALRPAVEEPCHVTAIASHHFHLTQVICHWQIGKV